MGDLRHLTVRQANGRTSVVCHECAADWQRPGDEVVGPADPDPNAASGCHWHRHGRPVEVTR